MELFVKLFLVHIIGDFVLQFDSWVKDKEEKKIKSPFLYLHIAVHFGLVLLVTWNLHFWKIAAVIAVSHYLIDLAKLYVAAKTKQTQWPFFVDQILHVAVLMIVAFQGDWSQLIDPLSQYLNWKIVTAYVFLSLPVGVIIAKSLSGWSFNEPNQASLPKAGKVIGLIERALILTFILLNHWEAIGFLITAKSIFRFNDLKVSDRRLTEYILIGTLLSFGIAIAAGTILIAYDS